MSTYTIQDTTLTGLADKVRKIWAYPSSKTFTPAQMIDKLDNTNIFFTDNNSMSGTSTPWNRPSSWPDLDSVTLPTAGNGDDVYLTYDLTKVSDEVDPFISLYIRPTSSATITVQRGTISNGTFTAAATTTSSVSGNTVYRVFEELDSTNGDVQVWRITSTSPLNRFGFIPATSGATRQNMMQPCVERYGRLDGLTSLSSGVSSSGNSDIAWGTFWLEREKLYMAGSGQCTNLSGSYNKCYSLVSLDVSNWTTTNWAVTSLQSMFADCWSLLTLDLSAWNTSNWAVTTMIYMFQQCYSLRYLKLGWNTKNWAVTNLSSSFYQCRSLLELNVNWDTSNWNVTNLSTMFGNCYSLKELDLNSWDTSNWETTKINNMFQNCYTLKSLKVDKWDTSEWVIDSLTSVFNSCMNLKTLDLSKWDVSKWRPTSLQYTFYLMISLKVLDLTTWDVSDWKPTNISYAMSNLYSLHKLDIHTWDTSGWTTLTSLGNCFSSLGAKQIYLPDGIFANATYTSSSTFTFNLDQLIDFNGYSYYKDNHSYSNARMLSHSSLVAIFNRLPTVTGTKTITIGTANQNKLTAAELAIATAKGWTIA